MYLIKNMKDIVILKYPETFYEKSSHEGYSYEVSTNELMQRKMNSIEVDLLKYFAEGYEIKNKIEIGISCTGDSFYQRINGIMIILEKDKSINI